MKGYTNAYTASMAAPVPVQMGAGILNWVGKYWFQLLLVLLGLHFAYNKDLSIQVQVTPSAAGEERAFLPKAAPAALFSSVPTSREAAFSVDLEPSRKLVERFAKVALTEREKFQIPASIILAQAILGSESGASAQAREANNYFGRPGLRYDSAWEGFREHSKYMRSGPFESLQAVPLTDYKEWAKGLQKLGYSKDRNYAKNLVRIIEALDLDQFDKGA